MGFTVKGIPSILNPEVEPEPSYVKWISRLNPKQWRQKMVANDSRRSSFIYAGSEPRTIMISMNLADHESRVLGRAFADIDLKTLWYLFLACILTWVGCMMASFYLGGLIHLLLLIALFTALAGVALSVSADGLPVREIMSASIPQRISHPTIISLFHQDRMDRRSI